MSIDNITLLAPVALPEGHGPSQFTLQLDTWAFTRLVQAAAFNILQNCHPKQISSQGLDAAPKSIADGFERHAQHINLMTLDRHEFTMDLRGAWVDGQQVYLAMHGQFNLLLTYVEWRNSTDSYIVGEEHHLFQCVYAAVCAFQHWKVEQLERGITENGTEFGSATGWFKTSYKGLVDSWPERFKLVPVNYEVPEIPCLRPDWKKRRIGWRIKNIEKLLSSDIRPTVVKLKYVDEKYSHAIGANIDLYVRDWGSEPNTVYVTAVHPSKFNAEWDSVYPANYDSISSINGSYV